MRSVLTIEECGGTDDAIARCLRCKLNLNYKKCAAERRRLGAITKSYVMANATDYLNTSFHLEASENTYKLNTGVTP